VIYKNLTPIIGTIGILVAIVFSSVTFANATNIYCRKERGCEDLTTWCFGTLQKVSISGNSKDNNIVSSGGNDIVDLGAGDNGSCGGPGEDKIAGGKGPDTLIGDGVYGIDIPLDCGKGHGGDQLI